MWAKIARTTRQRKAEHELELKHAQTVHTKKHSREPFIRRFPTISYALYAMASANTLFQRAVELLMLEWKQTYSDKCNLANNIEMDLAAIIFFSLSTFNIPFFQNHRDIDS